MHVRILLVALFCLSSLLLPACQEENSDPLITRRINFSTEVEGDKTSPVVQQADEVTLNEQPTISDYLVYAALHNPGLEAAFNRWKAAIEVIPQAKALPDPEFTFVYFITNVETGKNPKMQEYMLTQELPWLWELQLRGDAAAQQALAAHQQYQAARLELFNRVKQAYYEYYYIHKAVEIIGQNVRLLEGVEGVLRTRYKAAAAAQSDLIRVQVELGKLSNMLASMEDMRSPVAARLNAALNRPANSPLPAPQEVAEPQIEINDEQLLELLEQENPQLKAMQHEISRSDKQVEIAKWQYVPDISLGAAYRRDEEEKERNIGAVISVSLPIWWEKISAGVRQAKFEKLAAMQDRAEKINTLSADTKMSAFGFRDAGRKIDLYRDTLLPKAKQSLSITNTAFISDKASFTDLLDAQRILLEFELEHQRALADKAQKLSELEMLTGGQIYNRGDKPQTAKTNGERQ